MLILSIRLTNSEVWKVGEVAGSLLIRLSKRHDKGARLVNS